MTGFFNALSATLVLLMLMAVGYGMGAAGWMTASEKRFISKYIINIAVPCNCISGLLNNLDHNQLLDMGVMVVAGTLSVCATLVLSILLAMVVRPTHERWGVFVAMTAFSNTLFIGLPVSTQLFGQACLPYVMTYYLGHTLIVQSVGFALIERSGTKKGAGPTPIGVLKSVFTKPPILTVLFCIILLILDLRLPSFFMTWAGYISDSVSPMALIYCGYILYEVGLKNLRPLPGIPLMIVIRLGVAPVICWFFCRLFGMDGLALSVFVVESALPVVSQVTVMAGAFGADEQYAATGACLSTLCSFISIPILMLIMG